MEEPDAAVAIVRAATAEAPVLFLRRTERPEDPWSGHWCFPGGRREAGDRDPLHTALRELEEETGIRLSAGDVRAALPHCWARRKLGKYVLVAPFLFEVEREAATVLDVQEAAEAAWISSALLVDPARHVLGPVPAYPGHIVFPSIQLNGFPLWGFTYRLAADWLRLWPDEVPGEAASRVLSFLQSFGLPLKQDWQERTAIVGGEIPVREVLAHFTSPAAFLPAVNALDVRTEAIRLIGPAYEEYLIRAES